MTASGYIADRRCPGNPEHGVVLDMRDGGKYCPHHDHDTPGQHTKSFWREDEFEATKSDQPVQFEAPTHGKKQVRNRRRTRKTKRQ